MHSQGRCAQPSGSERLKTEEGPASEASRPVEGYRDATRSRLRSPQQLDIAHNVSSRPLEHLSDETLRLLVENARQLEEGSGVVIDEDGQVITE